MQIYFISKAQISASIESSRQISSDLQQQYTPDPEVLYGVMESQDHNSVACASRMVAEWRIGLPRTFAEPQP
jgi:hypothetical protein